MPINTVEYPVKNDFRNFLKKVGLLDSNDILTNLINNSDFIETTPRFSLIKVFMHFL
jgi:hypothetical protein